MEKLTLEVRIGWMWPAIDAVTDDRMSNESQMDPDLVCASGFDRDFKQRGIRKALDDTEVRHRRPSRPNY
jgi:hypothetical protein